MYLGLCPLKSWMIAVPVLAEPLGLSRTTPLECLNRSTARPFWLVVWFSGTRGFGRLLLRDFAGYRSPERLLKPQIDRPLVLRARSCSVGQGTLGLDNFPRVQGSSSQEFIARL